MKKKELNCGFFIMCSIFTNYLTAVQNNSAKMILAGEASGGRLGDNILLYCKAKYLSFKYGIPLVYKNFPFFDQLVLSKYEKMYNPTINHFYTTHTVVSNCHDMLKFEGNSTLFEISCYCQMRKHDSSGGAYIGCGEFSFDWIKKKMIKYPDFGDELKRNLQVLNSHDHVPITKNCISVAVAARMGSGGDFPLYSQQFFSNVTTLESRAPTDGCYADRFFPDKFAPQQFNIDQVKRLSAMLLDRTMHIYLFMDSDKNYSDEILAKWREALTNYKNITIECNVEKKYNERVLDDLCCMSECDCFIRGCSHFAGIAQLAGDHKIIMGPDPVSYFWVGNCLIFGKTFVYFQNSKQNKFEQYIYEEMDKNRLVAMAENVFNFGSLCNDNRS